MSEKTCNACMSVELAWGNFNNEIEVISYELLPNVIFVIPHSHDGEDEDEDDDDDTHVGGGGIRR